MSFQPKRLSYEQLRVEAEEFLAEYHAARTIPVRIAEIVEFDLTIEIVPITGLRDDLKVDAFLSNDY